MTDAAILTDQQIVSRLRQIVEEPDKWCKTDVEYVEDAADVIMRLINERDEARMQVCILGAVTTKLKQAPKTTLAEAMQIAEKFGWDCFSNEESGK
jgi:NCAIR mutase (PurE)-related protein